MLANRLNVLLAERQLTIKEVTEDTGLSRNSVSNISNNPNANISTETMDILCNYLEIEPKSFFDYAPVRFEFLFDDMNVDQSDKSNIHINNLFIKTTNGTFSMTYPIELSMFDQSDIFFDPADFGNRKYSFYASIYMSDDSDYNIYDDTLKDLSFIFRKKFFNLLNEKMTPVIKNNCQNLNIDKSQKNILAIYSLRTGNPTDKSKIEKVIPFN